MGTHFSFLFSIYSKNHGVQAEPLNFARSSDITYVANIKYPILWCFAEKVRIPLLSVFWNCYYRSKKCHSLNYSSFFCKKKKEVKEMGGKVSLSVHSVNSFSLKWSAKANWLYLKPSWLSLFWFYLLHGHGKNNGMATMLYWKNFKEKLIFFRIYWSVVAIRRRVPISDSSWSRLS